MKQRNLFGKDKVLSERPNPNPCVKAYGLGPAGKRCKECTHLYAKRYANVYYKCDLRANTNGPGTDHRKNWDACGKFEQGEQ